MRHPRDIAWSLAIAAAILVGCGERLGSGR
jgi:hypothetical protein